MYNVLKSVVTTGNFKLAEIRHKMKKLYALGDLSENQMDELLNAACGGVSAEAERPGTLEMLRSLSARMDAMDARLSALEGKDSEESAAYPEWKPWDGISDQYQSGAIVSHGGKLWQSAYSGQNVWEPGIGEQFWIEYIPAE